MAVYVVTTTNQNSINARLKGSEDIYGVYHPAAHHPYDTHIVRILDSTGSDYISADIGAPIATKGQN
jgi:hypothetical protein